VTPTDPLYAQQWHFALIGGIERVWDEYAGRGVRVYVVDDGLQYTHPDLAGNYVADHFTYGGVVYDPMPISAADAHGTACAGLIAARAGNGAGGVGVAWGANLTGLNFLEDTQYLSDEIALASLRHGINFDISSNSWGRSPFYDPSQSLTDPASDSARMNDVYREMVEGGRGGLGTIITQAAGNATLNAQGDGLNASRFTITVAATEQTGFVADYSNFGSCILISAPAAAVTTDLTGNAGYNRSGTSDGDPLPPDYTSSFGGTSAATPVVSGVVALMLEANPGLGWRDVQEILAASAQLTGSAYGGPGQGHEVGSWRGLGTDNQWNGGDRAYHLSYGYGMVDAYAATRMAEVWHLFGPAQTSANERTLTVSYSGPQVRVPPAGTQGTTDISFTVGNTIEIEHVAVTVTMQHSYAADLEIYLVAPDGQQIELMYREGGSALMDFGFTWTFGVDALRGYTSGGTWTVRFADKVLGDIGRVSALSLTFYGAATSANDVYHFTDDFLTLAAVESARRTIADTNGGTDWLNLAAIAGNVAANLAAGGQLRVNGAFWATLSPGTAQFENIVTGDGNDTLTGNSKANRMVAMRGNDTVNGGSGDDTIEGGGGRDRLLGGGGNDRLLGGDDADVARGGSGNDRLIGGRGDDRLSGEAGADVIEGGAGKDVLDGGAGNDTLTGGGQRDVFVFAPGYGSDRIADFQNDIDRLRLDDALWGGGLTAQQVVNTYASASGGNTVFDFGGGNILTVAGVGNPNLLVNDIQIV
jgi:subtilisin-like proprotein convertase family protein